MQSNAGSPRQPDPAQDLIRFRTYLENQEPFRFVRFSDGEFMVIRNQELEISESKMKTPEGVSTHRLASYDHKRFDPAQHQRLREDLIASLRHRGDWYFVGLPASHNGGQEENRDLGLTMHGGLDEKVTFADLLINSNYRPFLRTVLPILARNSEVAVVGNFRMQPELLNANWCLIGVPDNFMADYPAVLDAALKKIRQLPRGFLVLSSASSLTNILGMHVDYERPDLTFVDVGTALHPFTGMGASDRDYHALLRPLWGLGGLRRLRYLAAPHYRIRW